MKKCCTVNVNIIHIYYEICTQFNCCRSIDNDFNRCLEFFYFPSSYCGTAVVQNNFNGVSTFFVKCFVDY